MTKTQDTPGFFEVETTMPYSNFRELQERLFAVRLHEP